MEDAFPSIEGDFNKSVVILSTFLGWFAFSSNSLILWALFSSREKYSRDTTLYIIGLQALADLLIGLLNGSFGIYSATYHRFPGVAYSSIGTYYFAESTVWRGPACTLYAFLFHLFNFLSLYILVLTSWERYCSIERPFAARLTLKNLLKYFVVIFCAGILLSAFPIWTRQYALHTPAFCYVILGPTSTTTAAFLVILLAISCIFLLYSKMHRNVVHAFRHIHSNRENEISRQFFTIIACFMLCWMPVRPFVYGANAWSVLFILEPR